MFSFFNKKYKKVDVATFKEMKRKSNTVVLDVRARVEQQAGVINGQRNLNLQSPEFKKQITKMDKSKTYLIYCKGGSRSARACRIMAKQGFEYLYSLKGGYDAWERDTI